MPRFKAGTPAEAYATYGLSRGLPKSNGFASSMSGLKPDLVKRNGTHFGAVARMASRWDGR
jgi:hypothetical protein